MEARRILIVEDEKPLANALNLKLSSAGYKTTVLFDGEQALDELKTTQYDLMIIDVMMPKKDGWSVLAELQQGGSKMPVFVMSNLGQEEDVTHAKSLGAVEYLVKSNTPLKAVVERVKQYLP